MSPTLPPIRPLLQFADAHQPHNADYPILPRIFVGGASCLGKRALDVDTSLETLAPRKRPFRIANSGIERQLRTSLPLPVEIQNDIFETFWDHTDIECSSPETIRACALTCKTWSKVARRHIFRVIILRSSDQLDRFRSLILSDKDVIGWVRRVRLCGSLPPFDKTSSGKQLPNDWAIRDRWLYFFPYSLSQRIRDKSSENYQPFNIRIFELFDFAHLSGAVEDCQWFGFWLRHLPWLENVEILYVKNCEMSANAMDAFIFCFPRIRRVGLTNVDFTAKNYASYRHISRPVRDEADCLIDLEATCSLNGVDSNEHMPEQVPRNGVEYIITHDAPRIDSFYLNNQASEYRNVDMCAFYNWLRPELAIENLRSLELSERLDLFSIAEFINFLGPSSVLEHLRLFAGYGVQTLKDYEFDVSNLTNLKSISLYGGGFDSIQRGVHLHIFSILKAPGLRKITLGIQHDSRFLEAKELDDCLAERFKNLETFVVECVGLQGVELEEARHELKEMFPRMVSRGMLRVQSYKQPFRY